jgi:hypothetical protein
MTIVNDDSSIVSKWSSKIIDNARVVIYDHHMFRVQATGVSFIPKPFLLVPHSAAEWDRALESLFGRVESEAGA